MSSWKGSVLEITIITPPVKLQIQTATKSLAEQNLSEE